MNGTPVPQPELLQENNFESDNETNPDETPEYYQPISAVEYDDHDEYPRSDRSNSDEEHHNNSHFSDYHHHHLDNGHCTREAEDGISSLNLNDDGERKSSSEEDEEEDIVVEASNTAILRAFREDESRRNAPLTTENATRVMEAMRAVSFGSFVPDWAGQVSEEQWIDQLRRLRRPPGAGNQASVQN